MFRLGFVILAVSPCCAQGFKSACELISKADIESIMGFRVREPQSRPAKPVASNANISFADLITSSGCFFEPADDATKQFNGGIEIAVRYLRSTDAQALQERIGNRIPGASDIRIFHRNAGYTALWVNVGSSVVIFKETEAGTTVLQLGMYGPSRPVSSSAMLGDILDHGIKLATAILGGAKSPGVPEHLIVSPEDTLAGQGAMAVEFIFNGDLQQSTDSIEAAMEQRLRENGIKIVRPVGGATVPTLRLSIDTRRGMSLGVYNLRLEFLQLVPLQSPHSAGKFMRAITWSNWRSGYQPGRPVVDGDAMQLTAEFVKAYREANPAR
jgi:hypothetical protein